MLARECADHLFCLFTGAGNVMQGVVDIRPKIARIFEEPFWADFPRSPAQSWCRAWWEGNLHPSPRTAQLSQASVEQRTRCLARPDLPRRGIAGAVPLFSTLIIAHRSRPSASTTRLSSVCLQRLPAATGTGSARPLRSREPTSSCHLSHIPRRPA